MQYIDELLQIAVNDDPADTGEDDCETVYFACHNANFNVLGIVSDAGELVERYEYTPYGQRLVFVNSGSNDTDTSAPVLESTRVTTTGSVTQPWGLNEVGHQGLLHDKETTLIYNRARMHHPRLARFMQRDPLGYVDGMGLYIRASSNPVMCVDFTGERPWWQYVIPVVGPYYVTKDSADKVVEGVNWVIEERRFKRRYNLYPPSEDHLPYDYTRHQFDQERRFPTVPGESEHYIPGEPVRNPVGPAPRRRRWKYEPTDIKLCLGYLKGSALFDKPGLSHAYLYYDGKGYGLYSKDWYEERPWAMFRHLYDEAHLSDRDHLEYPELDSAIIEDGAAYAECSTVWIDSCIYDILKFEKAVRRIVPQYKNATYSSLSPFHNCVGFVRGVVVRAKEESRK